VDREARRVLQPLPRLREAGYAIWRTQRGTTWRVALLLPVLQLTVLAMAGLAAAQGRISAGQFLACAGYAGLGLAAFGQLDSLMELAVARSGLRRAAEVLDVAVTPTPGAPRALPDGPAEVRLRQVGARVPGAPVLTGVDLTIPAGATVALVGHSGAGKSTLAALVGRLYDPDEGAVLLDGVPVRAVPLAQLRRQVRYAFAEPVLLGRTVSDAIGYGCPDITPDAVRHAAEVACADAFIKRLPAGYDTPLSEAPLSGGETQRLGIARAVARAGRVMVLDDAMSNLDTATEQAVSVAIDRAIPDGTRLVVAHRLTTAARADLVAWLDGGRLRALAPHRELWHLPEYRRLFAADTGTATVDAPREAVR
jgi:ATP-binding cassette subfamily B protein